MVAPLLEARLTPSCLIVEESVTSVEFDERSRLSLHMLSEVSHEALVDEHHSDSKHVDTQYIPDF